MKIYWIEAQAPQRVLALIKYLALDVEFVDCHPNTGKLKSTEYARLNPNLKAPTLVDGDFVLWESSAIMAYLCIKANSDLWPAQNPREQVEVLRWLSWNDNHWYPPVSTFYFEHIVKKTFNLGTPNAEPKQQKLPDLLRYSKVLDEHLATHSYVACDRLTIADFYLASVASYWRTSDMPFEQFPNIVRWLDTLNEIPAWSNPWPAKTIN